MGYPCHGSESEDFYSMDIRMESEGAEVYDHLPGGVEQYLRNCIIENRQRDAKYPPLKKFHRLDC